MIFSEPIALYGCTRTAVGKLAGMHAHVEPHLLLASSITGTLFRESNPEIQSAEEIEQLRPQILEAAQKRIFDDVIIGNVRNSIGNIGRVAALEAGISPESPAITIDRQCASSMEAVNQAAMKLLGGGAKEILVGGVESASLAPWLYGKTSRPYAYFEPQPFKIRMSSERVGDPNMGETAEIISEEADITREQMDAFAANSHNKAEQAKKDGAFSSEIWPWLGTAHDALSPAPTDDECIREGSTADQLAKLRPVFRKNGRATAGNSSPLNDAAASAIAVRQSDLPSEHRSHALYVRAITTVGLDPNRMGLGPALAIPKLLTELGLSIDDVDLFEINEAFAGQVLACLSHLSKNGLELPAQKLNVFGGAIALGHPMGATGLRLMITLGNALRRKGLKRGIASLCIGGGQGMAALIETEPIGS